MKRFISIVLCLLFTLTLVIPVYAIKVVNVTGLKLDKTSVALNVGDTNELAVTFTPANTTQKLLTFSTSDKDVVAIDANGIIKAVKAGKAVITVASSSNTALKAVCTVTVKAKAPVTLSITVFDRGTVGGTPADNNFWTKWIQSEFAKTNPNIKLKFVTAPRWQEVNKLNVWMASNQAPDICLTYDVNSVFNYYKNGGLTQLDTALAAHGTQLKEFLGKSEYSRYLSGDSMRLLAPGYKDGVRFLNKMYNEGLIGSEFPLDRDGSLLNSDFAKGYVGSYLNNYDIPLRSAGTGYIPKMKEKIPGFNFQPIDPFKDNDGITTKQVYDQAGLRIIVPKTSEKRVNEVMQYLNWMANKDVIFFLQYGEEGVGHIMKNGLPIYQSVTGEKFFNSVNNIDYTVIVYGIQAGDQERNLKVNSLAYGGVEDLFIKAYKVSTTNSYVAPVLSVPVEADAKFGNTLKEKGYEVYAKTITAKPAEFEAVWNRMLNEFMKAGGQEVLDQRRAAWKAEKR